MSEAQMKVSDEIAISIENMNKWYGTFHVLRDINLDVQRGERIVICGPSGSGNPPSFAASMLWKSINKDPSQLTGRCCPPM